MRRVAQDCNPTAYMYTPSGCKDARIGHFSWVSTVAAKQAARWKANQHGKSRSCAWGLRFFGIISTMYSDIPLWLSIVMIIGGLVALAWSSGVFVDGAAKVAKALGISPFVVGMVIIGFGTSARDERARALRKRLVGAFGSRQPLAWQRLRQLHFQCRGDSRRLGVHLPARREAVNDTCRRTWACRNIALFDVCSSRRPLHSP